MDEVKRNLKIGEVLALPDELPIRPDISHLPDHVLRSNAVETVLQQNEELMSRISVSLRRISHLENIIDDQESKIKKFTHHYEVLKDETFILRQKSDSSDEEIQKRNKQINELKFNKNALDIEYTRLFNDNKEQTEELMLSIDKLNTRLNSHIKYKNKLKPIIQDFKNEIKQLNHIQKEYSGENEVLKEKLNTLTSYIKEQVDEFVNEKNTLLDQYDKDSIKINELEETIREYKKSAQDSQTEIVELRNQNISILRKYNEISTSSKNAITEKSDIIIDYKTQLKKLKLENLELQKNNNELTNTQEKLIAEQNELRDQLENTQLFFASLQKQFESEQTKTSSLQKINRRLSQEMNSYRSTIQSLKNIRDQKQIVEKPKAETINKIEDLIFEIERDFR